MTSSELLKSRLSNQQLLNPGFTTVAETVAWMGAMQAQDYQMAKWAIGIRLPNITDAAVEAAINNDEILRTHLLRPTWHFVAADDIYWLLELSAPRIKNAMKSRDKQLELTDKIYAKSKRIIEKALLKSGELGRKALITELENANIATDNNRSAHIMMRAELDGLVCSGATKGKEQTYALLEKRVPKTRSLKKEEALAKLAERYFNSHGPATIKDFAWWSGLSVTEARKALELVKDSFIPAKLDEDIYWLAERPPSAAKMPACLLPAFDEYLISYTNRSTALPFHHHQKAVSNNGIFWPTIIINGQVNGTWKRFAQKDKLIINTRFFGQPKKSHHAQLKKAAKTYEKFLGKAVEFKDNI